MPTELVNHYRPQETWNLALWLRTQNGTPSSGSIVIGLWTMLFKNKWTCSVSHLDSRADFFIKPPNIYSTKKITHFLKYIWRGERENKIVVGKNSVKSTSLLKIIPYIDFTKLFSGRNAVAQYSVHA